MPDDDPSPPLRRASDEEVVEALSFGLRFDGRKPFAPAWSRLCWLLTLGKGRTGKGGCDLAWADLAAQAEGLLAVLVPDEADAVLAGRLARLRADFRDRAYLALTLHRRPGDHVRLRLLTDLARAAHVGAVATGDVLYHAPERRPLQDVLTCIREGCTIDAAGFRRERHADRHLKAPQEMARLFARHPDAVTNTLAIVERCRFDLGELRYQYPDETEWPGETAQQALERLVWAGVPGRYPEGAARGGGTAAPARAAADRGPGLRALFPDHAQHRPLRLRQGHPVPGTRVGGELRRLLRAGRHQHRPGALRAAVRALRLGRAARTAGHRRGLRERAPRGGDPVGV